MRWLRGWRLIRVSVAILVLIGALGSLAWLTDTSADERIRRRAEHLGIDLDHAWPTSIAADPDAVTALLALGDLPRQAPPLWDGAPTPSLRERQSGLRPARAAEIAAVVVRLGHQPDLRAHRGAREIWTNARLLMLESLYVARTEDLPAAIDASFASVGDRFDAFTLAHALAWRIDDLRRAGIRPAFEPVIERLLGAYRDERLYLSAGNIRSLLGDRGSVFSRQRLFQRWLGEPIAAEILDLMVEVGDGRDPTTRLQRWRATDGTTESTMLLSRTDYARWLVAQHELREWRSHALAITAMEALRSALLDLPLPRDRCDISGAALRPLVRDGAVIGAYSIGVDLADDGGDRKGDIVVPLSPTLAAEMTPR